MTSPPPQDKRDAWSIEYEFSYGGVSTEGLPREGEVVAYTPSEKKGTRDTPAGDYAKKVRFSAMRWDGIGWNMT